MSALHSFGFLLKDTSRRYVQRFEQRAGELGLTLPQCKALVYLARGEGISQAQLSEISDIEPMTLVRILDRMESDGWVERRNDPGDRRARCLYLKSKAKPLLETIERLSALTRDEAFAGIPGEEAELAVAVLERVRANLAELPPFTKPAEALPNKLSGRNNASAAQPRRERKSLKQ